MRRFLVVAASLFVVTALFLTCTGQAVGQDAKTKVEPDPGTAKGELPKGVVAAWEKAGAEAGWMVPRWQRGVVFWTDRAGLHAGSTVPAFRFRVWPRGLATLPAPEQPFGLDLRGATDAKLKELAWLKQLTSLHLSFSQLTEAGIKDLAGLKKLTSLHLTSNVKVTDAGLKELAQLKQLTSLNLDATKLSDAGLKELAQLKQLTILTLWYSKVTDTGLKELAGLEQLTTLTLSNTQVTGTGLKELAGLKRLTYLELRGAQVTTDGLKELAELKHLTTLYLTKTPVTEAGVEKLHEALPKCSISLVAGAPGGGPDMTAFIQNLSEARFGRYNSEIAHLAHNPDVQGELKMTPEQIQKAVAVAAEIRSTRLSSPKSSTLESVTKTYDARSAATEKTLPDLLTADQRKRFRQIMLQIVDSPKANPGLGMRHSSASYPGVAAAIKLTPEQKAKLIKGTKPEDVLTDDQKTAIKGMLGEPYKGRITPTGEAPNGGGGGITGFTSFKLIYLHEIAVQSELKMSEEQIAKVKVLAAKQLEANRTNFSGPPAERQQKARELSREMEEGMSSLLAAVQSKRLNQVARQHRGVNLFTDKTLVGTLKLAPDQQEKLKTVQAQYTSDLRAASLKNPARTEAYGKEFVKVRAATINAAAELLTAEQKVIWQDYFGEPFPHYMPSLPPWLIGGTP